MRKRIILISLLVCVVCFTTLATTEEDVFDAIPVNTNLNKWASSKYFIKGLNAMEENDVFTAQEMFEKELKQHPSNGYAICNLAQMKYMVARYDICEEESEEEMELMIENKRENIDAVLSLFDNGLAKLPAADVEAQCQAYRAKALMIRAYAEIDSTEAAACYEKAIALHPCQEVYEDHMSFFYDDSEIVTADALVLRKLCPDDPSNVKILAIMAYRNADNARCLALCEEYNAMQREIEGDGIDRQIAAIHLMSLKELGREEEAMDLALKYIDEYEYGEAISIYLLISESDPDLAEIKVKQRLFAGGGDEVVWNLMLGRIMEIKKDYGSALEYFKKVEQSYKEAFVYSEIANCYYMTGDIDNALKYIDAATVMDGGEEYMSARDDMLINSGKASQVIDEKMIGVELIKNVNNAEFLQRLTLVEMLLQEHDYSHAVSIIEPLLEMDEGASALSLYATALKGLGRDDEAKRCLQKITEIDPMPDSEISELAPALYELGRSDEALEKANKLAQQWENYQLDPRGNEEPESCYTIATVFAQIGESYKALDYLEKHFLHDNMPYNFGLMERDWRLDSVRELSQYKTLVEKYKALWKSNATPTNK